jgi:flagellar motor switch/type III secretory pathway protein FliN
MRVLPFALLGASVIREVKHRMTDAITAWQSEWGLEQLDVSIECVRAWESSVQHQNPTWKERYDESGKSVWVAWQPDFPKYIQRQMFAPDQRHLMQPQNAMSIAFDMAEGSTLALADRMGGLFSSAMRAEESGAAICPDDSVFAVASGAVLVSARLGDHIVLCLLNHDCIKGMSGTTMPRMGDPIHKGSLNQALGKLGVTLPIELGQAEVDVGSLLTLAVGDVIRLRSSIDKPLTVYGPNREALFYGHLGTVDGNIAIEVVCGDK